MKIRKVEDYDGLEFLFKKSLLQLPMILSLQYDPILAVYLINDFNAVNAEIGYLVLRRERVLFYEIIETTAYSVKGFVPTTDFKKISLETVLERSSLELQQDILFNLNLFA